MIQQGGQKDNTVKRGDKGGKRTLRGARGPRSRASVGGGASKQKMGTDGGGAVNGISGIGLELAQSSVQGLSAFNPQPSPGIKPSPVLSPPLQSSGAS